MVVGVISAGIATPTEAAATGTLGCLLLSLSHGGLNYEGMKKTVIGSAYEKQEDCGQKTRARPPPGFTLQIQYPVSWCE
jgi:hypothetical protein